MFSVKNISWTFVFICATTMAQEKMNHISVDPFLPVFGTVQLQYERGINAKMSLGLSVGGKFSSGFLKSKASTIIGLQRTILIL